jgi:hypothetical protein
VDAIAVRRVEEFRASLEQRLREAGGVEPRAFLDMAIDAYVAFLEGHPDFRTIAFGRFVSASTRRGEVASEAGPAALIRHFVFEQLGIEAPPDLELRLRIVSEAGDRLIAYAWEQPTAEERARVIAETKQMLAGYLF